MKRRWGVDEEEKKEKEEEGKEEEEKEEKEDEDKEEGRFILLGGCRLAFIAPPWQIMNGIKFLGDEKKIEA